MGQELRNSLARARDSAEQLHDTPARDATAGHAVGLGLHLCRLVAPAHGGELRIRRAEPGLQVAMVSAPALAS